MRGGPILLGLTTVKGLGEDLARAIVAEREANGPYRSLGDLLRRTGLPRTAAEKLIAVGAMSDFGLGRRDLLWQLGLLAPAATSTASAESLLVARPRTAAERRRPSAPGKRRKPRQLAIDLPTEHDMVSLPEMDEWERMVADYGLLGLSPSYHPMGLLRPKLPAGLRTADELKATPDGTPVRTAGLVVCRQRPGTARGFVFLLLEDETGLTNVVVRPDLYEAKRSVVRGEPYLCVEGTLQISSGSLNVIARDVSPLRLVPDALMPRPRVDYVHPDNADDPRWQTAFAAVGALPRPRMQHPYPGRPHDPREHPAANPPGLDKLRQVAPPSHDFA